MSFVLFEDVPLAERPPVNGDWVALARPPLTNYMVVVHWARGTPCPVAKNLREIVRSARSLVESAVQQGDAPEMPFYCNMTGVWVGIVDPEAADWSPAIAFNTLPS